MTISEQEQDTVKQDSVRILSDSIARQKKISAATGKVSDSVQLAKTPSPGIPEIQQEVTDTTSVCIRNSISDVTFYDSNNLINRINAGSSKSFPFLFLEKNIQNENYKKILLVKHLKDGTSLPLRLFHDNWTILLILSGAFLFSAISTFSKKLFPNTVRFFLFRGTGVTASRDRGILYQWQSTLLNLVSFINLALFGYYAAFFYGIIPSGISGFVFWLLSIGVIIAIITLRHIICVITGIISEQREAFNEYLQYVYLFYRFSALIVFILVILMTFTVFSPAKFFFITGFILVLLFYIFRIIRLLIIFMIRNISIFYFILYLCALEILPAMVLVKYLTGLF